MASICMDECFVHLHPSTISRAGISLAHWSIQVNWTWQNCSFPHGPGKKSWWNSSPYWYSVKSITLFVILKIHKRLHEVPNIMGDWWYLAFKRNQQNCNIFSLHLTNGTFCTSLYHHQIDCINTVSHFSSSIVPFSSVICEYISIIYMYKISHPSWHLVTTYHKVLSRYSGNIQADRIKSGTTTKLNPCGNFYN